MLFQNFRLRSTPAINLLLRSTYLPEKCLCQRSTTSSLANLLHTSGRKDNIEKEKDEIFGTDCGLQVEKKSKAMKAYLERAQKYNAFMAEKREEFSTGRRHLANMMGVDHSTLTQKDIDLFRDGMSLHQTLVYTESDEVTHHHETAVTQHIYEAIEYLFPCGLFVPAARPFMKPPEEVFPPKKDAEFDDFGRPFHTLFYTGKPNYYQLLHDMTEYLHKLNRYEDTMISKNIQPDPNIRIELTGSAWITKEKIEVQLVEQITDKMYANLVELLDRVILHPYSYTIKDEVLKYRIPFMTTSSSFVSPGEVQYDDQGRAYVKIDDIHRKSAIGSVTVYNNGTGKILINDKDLLYFERLQSREQILFPLQFSGLLNEVDIEATVEGGGTSSQAGAVRLGIAMGIRHFVDEDMAEKMRIAGLLTPDVRRKERKKFGQMKARRKYTWKKR